jgi:hypothetical protein
MKGFELWIAFGFIFDSINAVIILPRKINFLGGDILRENLLRQECKHGHDAADNDEF